MLNINGAFRDDEEAIAVMRARTQRIVPVAVPKSLELA